MKQKDYYRFFELIGWEVQSEIRVEAKNTTKRQFVNDCMYILRSHLDIIDESIELEMYILSDLFWNYTHE